MIGSAPPRAKNTQPTADASTDGRPQTVTASGKKRRSRKRRRTGTNGSSATAAATSHLELLSARELGVYAGKSEGAQPRDGFDAWLPRDVPGKPFDFDFRLQVRAASIIVTPVLAGSRNAVPIADVLGGFNTLATDLRPVFRGLARHTTRSQAATAELRGEDAAEMLSLLRSRHVLLEPASMELRFSSEALKPRIELDEASGNNVRVRVVFESEQNGRRFSLSSGAWFEGTPGWYIDTNEGVARPVADAVTPGWLQRLYRSPTLVHPISDLPPLLTDFIPRVAASLGTELPDLSSVADLQDAQPKFRLHGEGDIIEAHLKLTVEYGDEQFSVRTQGFSPPLAFLPPRDKGARPRVVRRDVGAEMSAVQTLMNMGFQSDESGEALEAHGDAAIHFWTEAINELPSEWDTFLPKDLANVTAAYERAA